MSWNLDAAVGELTRPTRHRIVDPATGAAQWVIADPLLVQLVQAIANSGGSTAFKSSGGAGLPISAGALDLFQEIEATTAERWWACHGLHHGQGRGTLAGRLRAWAMATRAADDAASDAEEVICGWVRSIKALLQPLRAREIIGPCPDCGADKVRRDDGEGQVVRAPALQLLYDQAGRPDRAACAACGTIWLGLDIYTLAAHVNPGVTIAAPTAHATMEARDGTASNLPTM